MAMKVVGSVAKVAGSEQASKVEENVTMTAGNVVSSELINRVGDIVTSMYV